MDETDLLIAFHGIVALIWFGFGTVGLQTAHTDQALIGFSIGTVVILIGIIVSKQGLQSTTGSD